MSCLAFNPVKPILACGYKSGEIVVLSGKEYGTPLSTWGSPQFALQNHRSITAMDWNVHGLNYFAIISIYNFELFLSRLEMNWSSV